MAKPVLLSAICAHLLIVYQPPPLTFVLEGLHGALMLLGLRARRERAEIFSLASLRVFLPRIETVLARLQFSNHLQLLLADQSGITLRSASLRMPLSERRQARGKKSAAGSEQS